MLNGKLGMLASILAKCSEHAPTPPTTEEEKPFDYEKSEAENAQEL